MTRDELAQQHIRLMKAKRASEKLAEAEEFLVAVQGHDAVEQHEAVAQRLTTTTSRPRISGLSLLKANGNWIRLQNEDFALTPEMQEHLCVIARLLVQQYRDELAAL